MSLDVYLTIDGEPSVVGERIFVREGGATVQVTRDEWLARCPDVEPVAVAASLSEVREVFEANITHNLGRMAREAGLYEPLWRPDEQGYERAGQLIEPLTRGLACLVDERERLQKFNPANGWGDYGLLLRFTSEYLAACREWPDAHVEVSR